MCGEGHCSTRAALLPLLVSTAQGIITMRSGVVLVTRWTSIELTSSAPINIITPPSRTRGCIFLGEDGLRAWSFS